MKGFEPAFFKDQWPDGPWMQEEDFATGLFVYPWFISRNAMGAWCGYVVVPESHTWFGLGYDDVNATAHGGLTFSGRLSKEQLATLNLVGEWWAVGFDCSHFGDLIPALAVLNHQGGFGVHGVYRTSQFVRAEVRELIRQAAAAAGILGLPIDPETASEAVAKADRAIEKFEAYNANK